VIVTADIAIEYGTRIDVAVWMRNRPEKATQAALVSFSERTSLGRIRVHAEALGEVAPLLLEAEGGDRRHPDALRGLGRPLASACPGRRGGLVDPLGS